MSDFFKAKKAKTKSNEAGPTKPPGVIPWVEKQYVVLLHLACSVCISFILIVISIVEIEAQI